MKKIMLFILIGHFIIFFFCTLSNSTVCSSMNEIYFFSEMIIFLILLIQEIFNYNSSGTKMNENFNDEIV